MGGPDIRGVSRRRLPGTGAAAGWLVAAPLLASCSSDGNSNEAVGPDAKAELVLSTWDVPLRTNLGISSWPARSYRCSPSSPYFCSSSASSSTEWLTVASTSRANRGPLSQTTTTTAEDQRW